VPSSLSGITPNINNEPLILAPSELEQLPASRRTNEFGVKQ
jgi:hypothetical protein